jgi:hypothetical protein
MVSIMATMPKRGTGYGYPITEEPNTIIKVADETGIPVHQIHYAIVRGELKPDGPKVGRAYTLTDDQIELIKTASRLVALGAALYLAIRIVRNGWTPPQIPANS